MSGRAAPQSVLFACTLNRVRSPMAAALFGLWFGRRVFVDSCGVCPDGLEDGFAVEAIRERVPGFDPGPPKTFESVNAGAFDLIVCLSAEAEARAEALARREAVEVERWRVDDPTGGEGSRSERLAAYRRTREDLEGRIRRRFGELIAATST